MEEEGTRKMQSSPNRKLQAEQAVHRSGNSSRRRLGRFGLLLAAALVASVLLPRVTVSSGAATGHTVNITLGYAGGANIDPYYNEVIKAAEKALPGVNISQVVYPTYDQQLAEMPAQVAAGTIPDIIVWDNSAPVGEYAASHAIKNIKGLVRTDHVNLGVDPPALVRAWTINGKLYGVPLYLQDSAFVYNWGLLKSAGVTSPPKSMAEVRADAKLVKQKSGTAGLVILDNLFHLTQYVLAFGGGWHNGRTIDSSQNVAGLQFLVDMFVKDHSAILPNQVGAAWDGQALADNQAAMSDGGPWYIGFMAATAPSVKYTLAPIPTSRKGHTFVVTYGGAYTITSHSPNPAEDMKVIKVLTSSAAEHDIITSGLGFVPASSQYITAFRHATPKYDEITNAVLSRGLTLAYPPRTIQFQTALVNGFENIILRHTGTVRSLLASLQKQYGTT
jgi:multiple sugar transport system substrate-binding protein